MYYSLKLGFCQPKQNKIAARPTPFAPIAQRTERDPPEVEISVRIGVGAQL